MLILVTVLPLDFFATRKLREGLLPIVLQDLLAARKRAKNDLKVEKDPFKRAVLDGRQLALKVGRHELYFHADRQLFTDRILIGFRQLGLRFHRCDNRKAAVSCHLVQYNSIRPSNDRSYKAAGGVRVHGRKGI